MRERRGKMKIKRGGEGNKARKSGIGEIRIKVEMGIRDRVNKKKMMEMRKGRRKENGS